MNVIDHLNALRTAAPGCSLAAFGDLSTKLVLRVSSDKTWPQERLDDLCNLAARCFQQTDSKAVSADLLGGDTSLVNRAMVLEAREIKLFVRSEADPADMICCVCRSAEDLEVLTEGAKSALQDF